MNNNSKMVTLFSKCNLEKCDVLTAFFEGKLFYLCGNCYSFLKYIEFSKPTKICDKCGCVNFMKTKDSLQKTYFFRQRLYDIMSK